MSANYQYKFIYYYDGIKTGKNIHHIYGHSPLSPRDALHVRMRELALKNNEKSAGLSGEYLISVVFMHFRDEY